MIPRKVLLTAAILICFSIVGVLIVKRVKGQQSKKVSGKPASEVQELVLNVAPYSSGDPEKYNLSVISISPDRLLVRVEDELYLLNSKKEIVWHTARMDGIIEIIVDSKGRVFGIGTDMAQFTIDVGTGEVRYFGKDRPTSGRNYFSQIKPYKDGQYLVVESFKGYRNPCPVCPKDFDYDELTAWDGEKLLWEHKIPPDAEIEVWGDKILAVTKRKEGAVIQQINAP